MGLLCISVAGCRATGATVDQARGAFATGQLDTAASMLSELAEGPRTTRAECELDLAVVELARGDVTSAESRLRTLRDHFDALPQTVSVGDAVAVATDDNAREFHLSGYEQVMLRTLLALCSLAGDQTDAEAYCLQAQQRQSELARQAQERQIDPEAYGQIALAHYLRGTLREATHQNYDDAERAFRLVSTIQPSFAPVGQDIARAANGAHSEPGHGVVYVIACVGHGPRLVETVAETTTASMQIASMMLRAHENHEQGDDDELVLPNIASVKVPAVQVPPSRLAVIGVSSGSEPLGVTQTLTDLGQLACRQVEAEMPWTIARAVVRRTLKETSVHAASNALGLQGSAATVFEFAASSAWSGTEKADTRCWGLLPREVQVLRAELPAGAQTLQLAPLAGDGRCFAPTIHYPLQIEDGRNHYVLVMAPEQILSVVPAPVDAPEAL
ncbi:hypothetical protein FYK55_06925 [Roseiconus nitratireducens]|uniref:Uncharacterized protein n=1 Tax=Roseiconus nitratireducens TaxID=2605748 RepID=A0A5M6DGS6_9BACT|nr:hypothetical protein FYK55_06925 [Roseiconus nitratireducens]